MGPTVRSEPSTITPIRPHNASHSSIECVVKIVQHLAVLRLITAHRKRLLAASIPLDGSSNRTSCGLPISATATQSFLLLPPDSVPALFFSNWIKSKSLSRPSTSDSISLGSTPLMLAYRRSVSRSE